MELVGWLGGIFFAICAVPQAYKCWEQKHAHGVSYLLLLFWILGEIFTLIYVGASKTMPLSEKAPLLLNYTFNTIAVSIVAYYRLFPKEKL